MVLNTVITLCFLVIIDELQKTVAQLEDPSCSSYAVMEGETGEITFSLGQQINLTADAVSLYIARDNETEILRCESNLTSECEILDHHFRSEGINGTELILVTPNATLELAGVYVLHTVENGTQSSIASCNFTVLASEQPQPESTTTGVKDNTTEHPEMTTGAFPTTCSSIPIDEGMTGEIVYSLRHGLNTKADSIYIKRGQEQADILLCERLKAESEIPCASQDGRFRSKGIVGDELVLVIPNATSDLDDEYTLHVVVAGIFDPPTGCNFTVFEKIVPASGASSSSIAKALVPTLIALLILVFVVILICGVIHTCRKRCRFRSKKKGDNSQGSELQQLNLPEEDINTVTDDDI